ncbi:MAG: hypothetical protein Q7J26_15535 [Brevundimonas sp.]|uniref:hypothetical protein n=1 Tax=Brevundimonas sp. TaxID=1871086 RepID=UPI0027180281|nr:hypothetical protein [Brevundimonas sp.]MDO9609936.1 hypothetical protein [Brevundimonas sp.]
MVVIALAAALVSGQDTSTPRSASDLTRDLNSGPPFATSAPSSAPVSAPTPAPAQVAPAPATRPAQAEPVTQSAPAPQSSTLTRDLNSAPTSTVRPVTPAAQTPAAQTPVTQPSVTPPPARTPVRPPSTAPVVQRPASAAPAPVLPQVAPRPAPVPSQAPAQTPSTVVPPAPSVEPQGLDAAAMAALPFTLDLPSGTVLTQSRAGADARIYAVRRGDTVLVMIYAGSASQFPIYDGQMIQAGGRASIVVTEGGRRLAIEHLFQRATAPLEIHVWVASPDGADREQGERIAQSVDAR